MSDRAYGWLVLAAFQPAADRALHLPGRFAFGERVSLVPGFLAAGQGDLHLCATVLEVEGHRNDRQAALVGLALDLVDLCTMQQQLSPAPRAVVEPAGLGVLRDVHAVQPDLPVLDSGESADEGRPSGTERLHLHTLEHDPRLPGLAQLVVMGSLAVARDDGLSLWLLHRVILPRLPAAGATRGRTGWDLEDAGQPGTSRCTLLRTGTLGSGSLRAPDKTPDQIGRRLAGFACRGLANASAPH